MEEYHWRFDCAESSNLPNEFVEITKNYMPKVVDYSNNQKILDTLYIAGFKLGYEDRPMFSGSFWQWAIETENRYYDKNSRDFGKFLLGEILFYFFKEPEKGLTYNFFGYIDDNNIFYIVKTEVYKSLCSDPIILDKDEIINHFRSLINCGLISLDEYQH